MFKSLQLIIYMISMVVCQKCSFLLLEHNRYGYYYCPKCRKITYFIEFTSKC